MKIAKALPEEADKLTKISFEAKSFWQYPEAWIELWKNDLTITAAYIAQHQVYTLRNGAALLGFCAIEQHDSLLEVAHLWIKPLYMGQGLGKKLLEEALQNSVHTPATWRIRVVSDPNAEGFYRKMGFNVVAQLESMPPGRLLPVLEKTIA